jgi:hypothetical protein
MATKIQQLTEKASKSKRQQTVLRFPLDLETKGHGNIIRFNINVPSGSKYLGGEYGSAAGIDPSTGKPATPRYMQAGSTSLARRFSENSVRIDTTIDLFMPAELSASYTSQWNTSELGIAGAAADAASGLANISNWDDAESAWNAIKNSAGTSMVNTLAGTVQALTPFNVKDLATLATNTQTNPYIEVLFESVDNRTFSFTFKMIPRNAQEQQTIRDIVKTFKFHRAPEKKFKENNQYWLFPSTFDIMFLHKNEENPWLFKISTCAMTNFEVNHSPEGQYSAHEDGSPFATTITMSFTELEVLTKNRIDEGGF